MITEAYLGFHHFLYWWESHLEHLKLSAPDEYLGLGKQQGHSQKQVLQRYVWILDSKGFQQATSCKKSEMLHLKSYKHSIVPVTSLLSRITTGLARISGIASLTKVSSKIPSSLMLFFTVQQWFSGMEKLNNLPWCCPSLQKARMQELA